MRKDKNIKYVQLSNFNGALPPVDVEMEKVVLGAIMLEKGIMFEVERVLLPEVFYVPAHQEIYRAICVLYLKKEPIDILTVTSELRKVKQLTFVGGPHYISTLTNRVGSSANTLYHSMLLHQLYIRRKLIELGNDLVVGGYDDSKDCFDLLEYAQSSPKGIEMDLQGAEQTFKTFSELIGLEEKAYNEMQSGKVLGVESGIQAIDFEIGCWGNSDLIIIAARPGMGKSVLAVNAAKNAAKLNKKKVALFNLEMSALQTSQRIAADESEVDLEIIRKAAGGPVIRKKIEQTFWMLEKIGLYVDDKPTNSVTQIRNKCLKLQSTVGLDMVVIDYLQLIPTPELSIQVNPNTRMEFISRNLKLLAKELDVPVIALSQLSRKVEERGGNMKPMLSDLRDSGAIEQDADTVCFIWRPTYYKNKGLLDVNGQPYAEDYAELIVAKYRNGQPVDIPLHFNGGFQRFSNPIGAQFPQKNNSIQPATNFYEPGAMPDNEEPGAMPDNEEPGF